MTSPNNDESFRSVTVAAESAEPAASTSISTSTSDQPMAPTQEPSTNRAPPPTAAAAGPDRPSRAPRQKALSGPSTTNSPMSSRDTSPNRQSHRQPGPKPRSGLRSRKSSTDVSPNRGPSLAGAGATVPSAAAIQRALSGTMVPQLSPASPQDPSRVPRPTKGSSGTSSGDTTPHWPVSPRLKSPPPTSDTRSRSRRNSLRTQTRKSESGPTPSIIVQSSSPVPTSRLPVQDEEGSNEGEEQLMNIKAVRGGSGLAPKLETVQEASLPTTPAFESLNVGSTIAPNKRDHRTSDDERNDVTSTKATEDLSTNPTKQNESGGESNTSKGRMPDPRSASAQRPALSPKVSTSSLSTIKSRTDVSTRNMTVETETVPSIAQPTIGNQDRTVSGRGEGSLRLKPSNETIRPKKEKQKPKRKATSINSGTGRSPMSHISYHHHRASRPDNWPRSATASSLGSPASYCSYDDRGPIFLESPPSMEMRRPPLRAPSLLYSYSSTNSYAPKVSSKADVFEQKVVQAVDEANSSDSDATFIYESNPPEPQPHRSRQHHHSRTPSMTSIASLADPRMGVRDTHRNMMGKKSSMKFANPYNNQNMDLGAPDMADGTVRVGSGRVSGGGHHHHIGRHGHTRGGLNHILVDSDSSLAQSSRGARGPSGRYSSQPNSPRYQTTNLQNAIANGNGVKKGEFSMYDLDTENAADDERTPLISSIRSPRARTPRQRNSTMFRHQERRQHRRSGWCRKVAGCLVLSILVLVLIFSAVGLIFATTKPLSDVKVHAIQNVIASQEELMLDLLVEAVNPNIIGVTVADMDMNIFAKSKHVGSDKWWREHGGQHRNEEEWFPISDDLEANLAAPTVESSSSRNSDGIDEGTDPINDPDIGEPRIMLLGRIFRFDSPLTFDGSFFKHHSVQSLGAMRLSKPGNKTEAGGPERWEEVLQYPFELIVKGVFKYQLPLSTQERKVAVNASYHYDPDAEKKKLKSDTLTKRQLPPQPVKLSLEPPLGRYARALTLN